MIIGRTKLGEDLPKSKISLVNLRKYRGDTNTEMFLEHFTWNIRPPSNWEIHSHSLRFEGFRRNCETT